MLNPKSGDMQRVIGVARGNFTGSRAVNLQTGGPEARIATADDRHPQAIHALTTYIPLSYAHRHHSDSIDSYILHHLSGLAFTGLKL
jgi:hypothetical protein